eukprot:CAMPEP_0183408810 /NCGR_PEP_ID=MMETSP0370-20130417/18365_1 /TAXON_ID=268820 /ORGANISM="Peridinium aciculiferum, Strain PAER-2" /LENGTH=167 /DNA_ID=CAMNT_0025591393 /DNA_START=29 /DNA_END=530 /DNA_ORIENTATION=+
MWRCCGIKVMGTKAAIGAWTRQAKVLRPTRTGAGWAAGGALNNGLVLQDHEFVDDVLALFFEDSASFSEVMRRFSIETHLVVGGLEILDLQDLLAAIDESKAPGAVYSFLKPVVTPRGQRGMAQQASTKNLVGLFVLGHGGSNIRGKAGPQQTGGAAGPALCRSETA